MNKIELFFSATYPRGSYYHVLQIFLKKQRKRVSEHTVARLFYNLHPIGQKTKNAPITDLSQDCIKTHVDELWLRYAPDTMRTSIADIRHFFKWCKKKRHHPKNIAKYIKPIRRRARRRQRKAAPESDIRRLIEYLVSQIHHLVYRDIFGNLQTDLDQWLDHHLKYLRDLLIIIFLYETGARAGELSKLGSHTMNQAIKTQASAYTITVIGKTNDRDYMFTNHTAELWRIWEKVRPKECRQYAVIGWSRAHEHKKIKTNGISQMLARRCGEADVTPFRAHSLRHAKVRRSRRLVGLEVTSKLIDHSHIDTTRGYANIDEEELTTAAIKTGLQYDPWK